MNDSGRKFLALVIILGLLCGPFLAGQGGGCNLAGNPPPFAADKLSVLVVEETEQRTPQIDAVIAAIQQATTAAGGNFRRLDKDQADLSKDEPWVQAAWAAKGEAVPWLVAADKRRGVNQSLPPDPATAVKLLSPLGVKP